MTMRMPPIRGDGTARALLKGNGEAHTRSILEEVRMLRREVAELRGQQPA